MVYDYFLVVHTLPLSTLQVSTLQVSTAQESTIVESDVTGCSSVDPPQEEKNREDAKANT
jgi:hypothetical protein